MNQWIAEFPEYLKHIPEDADLDREFQEYADFFNREGATFEEVKELYGLSQENPEKFKDIVAKAQIQEIANILGPGDPQELNRLSPELVHELYMLIVS